MKATLKEMRQVVKSEEYTATIEKWSNLIIATIRGSELVNGHLKNVTFYEALNIVEAMKSPEIVLKVFAEMPDEAGEFDYRVLVMVDRIFSTILFCGHHGAKLSYLKSELIRGICKYYIARKYSHEQIFFNVHDEFTEVVKDNAKIFRKMPRYYAMREYKNRNCHFGFARHASVEGWIKWDLKHEQHWNEVERQHAAKKWNKFVTEFRAILAKTARRDLKEKIRARVDVMKYRHEHYKNERGFQAFDWRVNEICTEILNEQEAALLAEIERLNAEIGRLRERRAEFDSAEFAYLAARRMRSFRATRAKRRAEEQERQKTA